MRKMIPELPEPAVSGSDAIPIPFRIAEASLVIWSVHRKSAVSAVILWAFWAAKTSDIYRPLQDKDNEERVHEHTTVGVWLQW